MTAESASGRNLLRVLLERRYGVRAVSSKPTIRSAAALRGEPTLLIGDRAIDARRALAAKHVYDLGRLWHEWTGLDMVYAVWAVRRDVFADAPGAGRAAPAMRLREARAWGMRERATRGRAARSALRARPVFTRPTMTR